MSYKFILDEAIFKRFVDWLPELNAEECYYVVALARNKYVRDLPNVDKLAHIRSDKQQIARFVCNKERLVRRVRQLECALGAYKTKEGLPVPQEAMAVYISVNPRSHLIGAKNALKRIADLITQEYSNYRLDHEVLSCIQEACSRKIFMDIDFDGVPIEQTIGEVKKHINLDCVSVLKTRGGAFIFSLGSLMLRKNIKGDGTKRSRNFLVRMCVEITSFPSLAVRRVCSCQSSAR